ncbi:MAG: SPOR domain-containing protein [Gammaproteobacteria bacterium]
MARDYKNRSSRNSKSQGRLGGIMTFAAGLLTGLCVAAVLYLLEALPNMAGLLPAKTAQTSETPQADSSTTPVKLPEPTDRPAPRFDFYTILPEMEVSVPEWETPPAPVPDAATAEPGVPVSEPADTAAAPATTAESDIYVLQIGSFRQHEEADRVKARLALLGISTEIQRVVIDGDTAWHRVRAGPYREPAALNDARKRLQENAIDFMLLKLQRDET